MASVPLEVVISATDRFSGTANRIAGSLGNLERSAGRVGRGVGQVAGGLARLSVIGIAAAATGFAAVARATINWESALAGVNKTMDLTPSELQTIGREIRGLATEIPLSANAIAGLVEQAGALGIVKEDVVAFAEAAATIGVTTNVTADQAATSLGVLSNLLGLTGTDFERFGSTLVDLGNKGASTEDQILAIAERAAGAGATIGLTADELLGFASAIANLGIEPEAGGSSLQRVFIDTAKLMAKGGDDLETFAATAGVTTGAIQKMFETDAAGAIELFVDGLAKLDKTSRLNVLDALGWDDIRVGRMLLGLAEAEKKTDNLSKSLAISSEAWQSNTAAAVEADKRYGTVASKLSLLKNQAIESALLIGEGFLPSLGKLADKLKVFLASESNRAALTSFGQEIGKVLAGIDLDQLLEDVRGLGRAFRDDVLPVLQVIAGLINALPTPIKAAGAALAIGANTPLVGGAVSQIGKGIANIVLGTLGMVGGRLPGPLGAAANRLFAQPVFVTNWPIGFGGGGALGGAGAAGGAAGFLSKAIPLAVIAASAFAVWETWQGVNQASTEQAQGISATLDESLAGKNSVSDLQTKLAAINTGIQEIESNPLLVLVQGEALDELKSMREKVEAALALGPETGGTPGEVGLDAADRGTGPQSAYAFSRQTGAALQHTKTGGGDLALSLAAGFAASTNPSLTSMNAHLAKIAELIPLTTDEAEIAKLIAAQNSIESTKVDDIYAVLEANRNNPPIVNVTVNSYVTARDVTGTVTIQSRVGPPSGSHGRGRGALE